MKWPSLSARLTCLSHLIFLLKCLQEQEEVESSVPIAIVQFLAFLTQERVAAKNIFAREDTRRRPYKLGFFFNKRIC